MSFENAEYIHRERNKYFCVLKQEPKDKQFSYSEYHQPNYQLYDVYLVIYMPIQFLVRVSIYVLRVVQVKIDPALQDDNIMLCSELCDQMVEEQCYGDNHENVTRKVNEVPFTSVSLHNC